MRTFVLVILGVRTIGKLITLRMDRKARKERAAFWVEHERKMAEIRGETQRIAQQ